MKTLQFTTTISAPRETVWKVLWDDTTYRQWTNVFAQGSYALSAWKEGARVHFLSPSGDGMFSEIAQLIPNEYMAFRHLGTMKGGKEQPETEETKSWAGAMETYTLKENNGQTELLVSVDTVESFEQYMRDTFPKALEKVKLLSES